MPRKTDSNNPADWLWIAESDLPMIRAAVQDDPDWPTLRVQLEQVAALLAKTRMRVGGT